MILLLDTHCWLWMQTEPERFSDRTRELLEDPGNDLLLSAASSWEIAIKYAMGRLALPAPPSQYVPDRIASSGVVPLPVHHAHALEVANLPPLHKDPVDRILIAQARLEGIPILTADAQLTPYQVETLWAI